jgi:phosphoribosyl-AMP cyclohydrolase
MVAFLDEEALAKTRETGLAHFHSRSRGKLWLKGETSGHFLRVQEMRVDCDQDVLIMIVRPEGPACHTGARSCFYRVLDGDHLVRLDN